MSEEGDVKVLYILARGRTGSTIVSRALGEVAGFLSVGEVRSLWDPVAVSNGPCGCGEPVSQCPVWGPVVALANPREAAAWQREVVTERNLPRLLRSTTASISSWPALAKYSGVMGSVYSALGARVIVDSSKRPSYGAFLRLVPGVQPFYAHLVRDPRASAFSWKQRRYESITSGAEVTRRGAVDATIRWNVLNLEAELLRRAVPRARSVRIRLEDFVASPQRVLGELLRLLDEEERSLPFIGERSVRLGASHAIGGNPSGRRAGVVEIRDDSEWKRAQGALDRRLAATLALPLMRRYGYPLAVSSSAPQEAPHDRRR
jgi:hypothetical protein